MKTLFYSFFTVLLLVISVNTYAQKIDSSYEVATWFGFHDGTLSYTFDDGCPNQFAKAIPMFDEFGYKLTLFTVVDWSSSNWEKLKSAAKNGHEVASHTMTHPNLSKTSLEMQLPEFQNSRDEINRRIPEYKCVTIAYPFCAAGDQSICRKYYISARSCQGLIEGKTPKDFMNVSSIACGSLGNLKTADDLNRTAQTVISTKGWGVFLFHGIDDDGGYSPISSVEFRKNLDYIHAHDNQLWVSTFSDASRYILERNAVNVKELLVRKKYITLSVTDTLDNAVFNHAISLRRILPDGWTNAEVTQDGKSIISKLVEVGTSKNIQFNVVPDAGEVKIIKRMNASTSHSKISNR
jgi:peptidoglycan/xylan/chitin deacetylase (PgdA/CDA1 family)